MKHRPLPPGYNQHYHHGTDHVYYDIDSHDGIYTEISTYQPYSEQYYRSMSGQMYDPRCLHTWQRGEEAQLRQQPCSIHSRNHFGALSTSSANSNEQLRRSMGAVYPCAISASETVRALASNLSPSNEQLRLGGTL